jgi:hypothetical protein
MRVRLFVGLLIALAVPVSSAEAAGFNCSASAGRFSALGQAAIEPVTANAGATACTAADNSLGALPASGLPVVSPISSGAVVAATEVYSAEKGVLATGGLADLRVLSLPTLPIALPAVTIPAAVRDALKTTVSLTAVKALIPSCRTSSCCTSTGRSRTQQACARTGRPPSADRRLCPASPCSVRTRRSGRSSTGR